MPEIKSGDDIVYDIASRTGATRKDVRAVLAALVNYIPECVAQGTTVSFYQFGRFVLTTRKERLARNMATGKPITVPSHISLRFKPSSAVNAKIRRIAADHGKQKVE